MLRATTAATGDDSVIGPALEEDEAADEEAEDAEFQTAADEMIRPAQVVGPGVTSVTVSPTVLAEVCDAVRAEGLWEVSEDSLTGDTFTLTIPSQMNVAPGVRDLYVLGEPQTPENLVAKMQVSGSTATFIMQVDGANGGSFYLDSQGCWGQNYVGQDVVLPFTSSAGGQWSHTVTVPAAPPPPATGTPSKSGAWVNNDDQGRTQPNGSIRWTVYFPTGSSGGAQITDAAQQGWQFDLDSFQAVNTDAGTAELNSASTTTNLIVDVDGYIAASNPPGFTINANLVAPYPDPDGQGRITFNNSATAYNTTLDDDPVPPGSDSASVTQNPPPAPIEPGVNPTKTGKFTRGDEGRVLPGGALEWTVKFPIGSSNGATITDSAMPGWEFDCDSFNGIAAGGVTPTVADGDCTADSLTVTVGAYEIRDNAPSFTISANIIDASADSFNNCVSSVNTVADGDDIAGSACLGSPLTRQNIPGAGQLVKSGELITVDGEQRIRWTVTFPTGAWDGGEIIDVALPGWTFDTTTFSALNTEQVTAQLSPSSSATSVTVNVGEYMAPSNPPGFTIEAVLNADESTWPTADGDGNTPFSNTANATMDNYGGDGQTQMSDSDTVLLPPPPGPPETGINPVKTGAWTDPNEQGSVFPNGTIRRTVVLPHGPASGAVITDQAGEGWEFDCESFEPDTRWFDGAQVSMDADCTTDLLIVTVGAYGGDEWYVPQFSIEANITLTPSHMDGRGFNNSVTSLVTDVTGEVTRPGSTTTDWLVQQSGFGGDGRTYTIPVTPTVNNAVCVDGVEPNPSIQLPANAFGLTYEVVDDSDLATTGEYTISATIAATHQWGNLPTGWIIDEEVDPNVAIYSGSEDIVPCVPVDLLLPTVAGAVCEGGVEPTDPSVTIPVYAEGDDVRYVLLESALNQDGTFTFVVTAELIDTNKVWPTDLPSSDIGQWELLEGVMTFDGSIGVDPCNPVAPVVLPELTVAVCEDGVFVDQEVNLPDNGNGITYTEQRQEDGSTIVTATLADTGYAWDIEGLEANGWTRVDALTAEQEVPAADDPCDYVLPIAPEVIGNVCVGGEYTPAEAVEGDGPEGVSYSDVEAAGGRITATATLSTGQAWDTTDFVAPGELGWSVDPADAMVAHFIGAYVEAPCAPAVPVNPVVQEAVCRGGVLIDPVVTTVDSEGRITYTKSGAEVSGGTVTVTATLADGYEWDAEMPIGWSVNPENPAEATYVLTLDDVECEPVVPVAPVVTPAVCEDGGLTPPSVTLPTTPGITYTKSGAEVPGGTVTITATVEPGYGFGELPTGWTINPENPAEATYVLTLEDVECEPVVPVAPAVTPAVCEDGGLTPPSVTLPTTPGITYTKSGTEVPGGTVTITATVEPGYAFGELPTGWTINPENPAEATYVVTIEDVECEPVVPVAPVVTPAVCEDGKIVPPSLELPTTPGVAYTVDGEVVSGGKVTITATLQDGYAWGEMPEGWTLVDATTATFEVTFPADPACDPAKEKPEPVTKLPDTGSGSETNGLAMIMASMAGLMLAAVALRVNAYKRS